jgi:hypothetical protein
MSTTECSRVTRRIPPVNTMPTVDACIVRSRAAPQHYCYCCWRISVVGSIDSGYVLGKLRIVVNVGGCVILSSISVLMLLLSPPKCVKIEYAIFFFIASHTHATMPHFYTQLGSIDECPKISNSWLFDNAERMLERMYILLRFISLPSWHFIPRYTETNHLMTNGRHHIKRGSSDTFFVAEVDLERLCDDKILHQRETGSAEIYG